MRGRGERIAGTGRSMGWYREGVQLGRAAYVLWRSPGPPVLTCPYLRFGNGAEQKGVESQLDRATCSREASGTQVWATGWDSEGSGMSNQAHRKRRSTRWVRFVKYSPARPRVLCSTRKSGQKK